MGTSLSTEVPVPDDCYGQRYVGLYDDKSNVLPWKGRSGQLLQTDYWADGCFLDRLGKPTSTRLDSYTDGYKRSNLPFLNLRLEGGFTDVKTRSGFVPIQTMESSLGDSRINGPTRLGLRSRTQSGSIESRQHLAPAD